MGTVWSGSALPISGVRFVDLNGDGRADWIWVSDAGAVTTEINHRDHDVGWAPVWVSAGITHGGADIGVTDQSQVHFGKVAGTDKPSDYTYVYAANKKDMFPTVELWQAAGGGGCYLNGDGMDVNGDMTLYSNIDNPPNWSHLGGIGIPAALNGEKYTRKDLHLADIDGDGKCDVIFLDSASKVFQVYLNQWDNSTGMSWSKPFPYTSDSKCNNKGIAPQDLAVRLADIDGDGRADFLWLDLGRKTASLSTGTKNGGHNLPVGFKDMGQVKFSQTADRANVRFVGVNGDGRADYIWLNKVDGSFQYWSNEGPVPAGGGSFTWIPRGIGAEG
ncbi:Fc.00g094830.m01.CDS01 [Cosmosporella sp. VM-42]